MKRGYTIIELMTVVCIIGILMGIVVTAAQGSIASARVQKANAICSLVEQGLATYYAQRGEWPGPVGDGGSVTPDSSSAQTYTLSEGEVRETVRAMIKDTKNAPVMDVSGLFVCRNYSSGKTNYGMDFMDAVHGTRKSSQKMKLSEMYFGYPEKSSGHFRPIKITYNTVTDTMSVSQ